MAITRNINDDNTLAYLFKKTVDIVYPVGSIYMSLNSTSPNKLFGGTWERITGRFLLAATDGGAAGGNGNASIAPGNTGGEAVHQLIVDEMPSHTHIQDAHTHGVGYRSAGGSGSTRNGPYGQSSSNVGNVNTNSITATGKK